ncbi:hypothetical protein AVEN_140656-1 [Araneus ventricosus]|uniref:Uncharacterized protein n=1 Tax=Araneus ventricosus TaxID=182803 RepID=A0A4Y2C5Y6_ARAVE|nr:hypothetical protein AVEN_140656-1 [Araneus ventricosus]
MFLLNEHLLPKKQPPAKFQVSRPRGLEDFVISEWALLLAVTWINMMDGVADLTLTQSCSCSSRFGQRHISRFSPDVRIDIARCTGALVVFSSLLTIKETKHWIS